MLEPGIFYIWPQQAHIFMDEDGTLRYLPTPPRGMIWCTELWKQKRRWVAKLRYNLDKISKVCKQ